MTAGLEFIPEDGGGVGIWFRERRAVANLGDYKLPSQKANRRVPRWLMVVITALVSSVPVAGVSLMAWPFVQQQTSIVPGRIESAGLTSLTLLNGWFLASYALRGRRLPSMN